MIKVLIDSDVCLDYVLQRTPFDAEANVIFEHLEEEKFQAFVCALTPTTVFYFTRKARDIGGAYAAINDLILTAQVCLVDLDVLRNAEKLGFSDYEDAVQCASAIAEKLDAIITRNTKDYLNSPIPVYTPTEFLEVLGSRLNES